MTVIIYTDGALKSQQWQKGIGFGGWAWYVNDHLWDSGAVGETTNNRMEMLAVIQAFQTLRVRDATRYERLLIVSDSAYVVNCFADQWYVKWRANAWINGSGKPVVNQDYWETMLGLYEDWPAPVTFRHCRGHGRGGPGDAPYVAGNAEADKLAVAARLTLERRS